MKTAKSLAHSAAFTLLEIMVAIALLMMVIVAIYSTWNAILKGSRVALDAAAEAQRSRITMRTLHDSLLCSCMFIANGSNYTFDAESESDFSSLSFVADLPKSFPRSGKFGDLSMRRLNFTVESGTDSSKQLVLRQRPLIADFDKDELETPLVLARDVTKFKVEFVDPQTGELVTDWTVTNQLPTEVFITLGLGHLDQFSTHAQDEMYDVVALPALAVRAEWQTTQNAGQTGNNQGTNNNNNGAINNPGGISNTGGQSTTGANNGRFQPNINAPR